MVDRRSFLLASGQFAAAMLGGKAFGRDGTDNLAYLPASELLTRFRERKLSPVDVLEAQIARIKTLNDKVNCITFKHFDETREAARESEKRYADAKPRALEGITVAVKDEYETKGWVTTMGRSCSRTLRPQRRTTRSSTNCGRLARFSISRPPCRNSASG